MSTETEEKWSSPAKNATKVWEGTDEGLGIWRRAPAPASAVAQLPH